MTDTSLADADRLRRALGVIAGDFAFTWVPDGREIFASLDPALFRKLEHNPTALLAELGEDTFARSAADPAFVARVERVERALADERTQPGWWEREHAGEEGFLVAYFSCEFGLDESLPIYAGGLGVLAGEHLKSASELGVPLVGVGLLYREGYFRQRLDDRGRQTERYPVNDPARMALERLSTTVELELADDAGEACAVRAQVWRARVGRVDLYLLDPDVGGNPAWAREVCDRLYGGDRGHRIRQEVLLGVGGVRALAALGLRPAVWHLNEGHSAFLALERLRALVRSGRAFANAFEEVRASTVLTVHTPVPAGNEVFEQALVERHVGGLAAACGLGREEFLALGQADERDGAFGMTPFALRCSQRANGVSALHGEVSREMWKSLWPGLPPDEVPIGHVTNGVHARTWLAPRLADALSRGSGADGARGLDDDELWRIHAERKASLVGAVRERGTPFDPEALTIGFARRFAPYKRATLLLSLPVRLARLLADPDRPVQILFAGKAHPLDGDGKALIQQVVAFARSPLAAGRVAFLEDYELTLARSLVQGVDVWLNNPRRPQEASGTSGMKAALNGVLNCSVLDGWWAEGYTPEIGWAIGDDSAGEDDAVDAEELFAVLEQDVVPAFYNRDENGLPRRWLAMMRASIADAGERFTTERMVREYVERYYLPAHRRERDGAPAPTTFVRTSGGA